MREWWRSVSCQILTIVKSTKQTKFVSPTIYNLLFALKGLHAVQGYTRWAIGYVSSWASWRALHARVSSTDTATRETRVHWPTYTLPSQSGIRDTCVRQELSRRLALCSSNTIRGLFHTDYWSDQMHVIHTFDWNVVTVYIYIYITVYYNCINVIIVTIDHWYLTIFYRQSRCHYLDGGCLSSPRWTSLLVAEIFYPDTFVEENQNSRINGLRDVAGSPPPVHDFQNYQQYLQKRAGENEARNSGSQHHCDGVDEMGCFQVIRTVRY